MALSHGAAVVGSAAREEVSKLLAAERAERKRAAAALSHHAARIKGARGRTPADKQAVMSGALSIPHPDSGRKPAKRAAGPPRVAKLAGRAASPSPQSKTRRERRGFGTSSPARVRKPEASKQPKDKRRPTSVPRVARLAAAVRERARSPAKKSPAEKKGFGASVPRNTHPTAWDSSISGSVRSESFEDEEEKGDEEEDSRPIKAAMRWMKSPTKSSVAKQASRVERQNAMKKGFGSSTPRDPEQELEWSLMGDKAEAPETMSGRLVNLLGRLVPPEPEQRRESAAHERRGFGTSSPARRTDKWLAPQRADGRIGGPEEDSWSSDDGDETQALLDDDNVDVHDEQAQKWRAEADAAFALGNESPGKHFESKDDEMEALHAVQRRLITEIEAAPDNLELLQHLAKVDRAMALAVNAGAKAPPGRSPPQKTSRAARQDREKERRAKEKREKDRRRRASSPISRVSRLLRPTSARDSPASARRRVAKRQQINAEKAKELTFQPAHRNEPPPRPADVSPPSASSAEHADGEEELPISERLYQESARRAKARRDEFLRGREKELATCTFKPTVGEDDEAETTQANSEAAEASKGEVWDKLVSEGINPEPLLKSKQALTQVAEQFQADPDALLQKLRREKAQNARDVLARMELRQAEKEARLAAQRASRLKEKEEKEEEHFKKFKANMPPASNWREAIEAGSPKRAAKKKDRLSPAKSRRQRGSQEKDRKATHMADTQASRQRRFLQHASEVVGGGATNHNRKRRGKRKSKSPTTRKAEQEGGTPTRNDADEAKNAKTEELDELLQFPASNEFPSPPSGGEQQGADDSSDPHSPPPSGWETEAGAKKLTEEV